MEAARVLGERGHQVVVFEALDEPGGQVKLASRVPRRKELLGIIDWRISMCEKAGVEICFNQFAEKQDVISENPELVIIGVHTAKNIPVI